MANNSLRGFANSKRKEDTNDSTINRIEERFVTVLPLSSTRAAIDTMSMGLHRVTEDAVAEAIDGAQINVQ